MVDIWFMMVNNGWQWVSIVMGVPQNEWFIGDNPIKMDDETGYPYFRKQNETNILGWNENLLWMEEILQQMATVG